MNAAGIFCYDGQPISLFDMLQLKTNPFLETLDALSGLRRSCQGKELVAYDPPMEFLEQLDLLQSHLKELGCFTAAEGVDLLRGKKRFEKAELQTILFHIETSFQSELKNCILLGLNAREATAFQALQLFGQKVETAFPSATTDICEAGRSLAV